MNQPAGAGGTRGWRRYWDGHGPPTPPFRHEAATFAARLGAAIPLTAATRVLDFGSGLGLVAAALAPQVGRVWVWDASPTMRRHTAAATATYPNVAALDLEDPGGLPAQVRVDVILVNSVVQYMTAAELTTWMSVWVRLLAPDGCIVLSDVMPPDHAARRELLAMLRRQPGLIVRSLRARLRYALALRSLPQLRLGRDDLNRLAVAHGLGVEILPANLTHFPDRLAAVFRRVPR